MIVVDTSSSSLTAVLGDLVCTKARHRGVAGFVVDGLIRDLPAIRALGDFPVFARGVTPKGPLHRGPGEIGHPISCGGIVVNPGDVIVGDLNGVVVVPRDISDELLERLEREGGQGVRLRQRGRARRLQQRLGRRDAGVERRRDPGAGQAVAATAASRSDRR